MATAGSGRGPIKVGSGYIDVFPKVNKKQLEETRAKIEKQMGLAGKTAGKMYAEGISAGAKKAALDATKQAEKTKKAREKEAKKGQAAFKRIEAQITRQFGEAAAERFRIAAGLEEKKTKLLRNARATDKKALQETVRQEEKAAREQARREKDALKIHSRVTAERMKQDAKRIETLQRAEIQAYAEDRRREQAAQRARDRISRQDDQRRRTTERAHGQYLRDKVRAEERANRQMAAAHRRAHQQMRDDLRRTLTEARSARIADLRSQMDAHRDQQVSLRNQLRDYRRQMNDHTRAVGRSLSGLQTSWRRNGEAIERLGTNVTETGRMVSMNLLAPLAAVSGMLTTIGVKSADMRILGQMGLSAAGVSKRQSAAQMSKVQQYAIDTPFSIDTMHEYQMKLIRSIAGNDNEWYKPKTKTKAADRAASKTTDIIMAIGDTMARAGNLDPEMFKRAMYATDRIMDLNKAPTRNINQLVQATGMSGGELARMFGFKDAGEFWKTAGTPVAKGGGISGEDMIDNLLQNWDPGYFEMRNGKRRVNAKTGQAVVNPMEHSTRGGSAGYGEKMTSATITGRISQMKEQAQFNLGSLFAQEDPKTGEYKYTGLGRMIMGKPVDDVRRVFDKKTGTWEDQKVGTKYEGGLLNDVLELGSGQKENIITLIKTSIEALSVFVEQIQWFSDWLEAHPKIKEVFATFLKIAAVALPFIIAIGLLTKIFGKVGKIFGAALAPVRGISRGVRAGTRTARQGIAGNETENSTRRRLEAERDARRAQPGNRGTRWERFKENRAINKQSRQAGNQAYRDRRTQLRGGDVRGPIARTRDRITGRDSGSNRLRTQMRETEDAISETEEAIRRLQRELRDVNSTSINQLVNQFSGTGSGNLQGAANNANNSVYDLDTIIARLNRATLGGVSGEVTNLDQKFKDLNKKVKKISTSVDTLSGKNLTSLKISVDSAHGAVGDLKDKIDNTALAVSALNRKELGNLSDKFRSSTSAADKLHDKIRDTIDKVADLNGAKLGTIRGAFHGAKASLYNAVNDVYKLVGTSKSGLHGRLVNMNNRNLDKVTSAVNGLKDALSEASKKADTLNTDLGSIAKKAPGGGDGTAPKKPPRGRRATGGVLPGYTPGRDVHLFSSPTAGELHLSGGEAVMRPEFTAAIGESEVNRINLAARTSGIQGVRHAMQFADGGKLNLDAFKRLGDFNLFQEGKSVFQTLRMDSSSDPLGGSSQQGILRTGDSSGRFLGGSSAGKFHGAYDWLSTDMWGGMKRLPTVLGQVAGILGGAIAPVQGEYFWDDVWKGQGNILERGQDYLGDIFSTKTIGKVWDNLSGGIWESLSSLYDTGKGMLTDPVGYVSGAIGDVFDIVKGQYNNFVGMIDTVKEIKDSPMGYADRVFSEYMSTARESMPNTKGLFDFDSGDRVNAKAPDASKVIESGGPGTKRGLSWARTQNGKPYQWGGNGDPSWDCSGYLSAIESVIRGQHPHRRWATGAFRGANAPDGWIRNFKSPFMIGITNAGVGHTAGTLNGVNVESRGGDGVVVGPRARGANSLLFTDVYGFHPSIPTGYASGTMSASPGLAVVGERGREIVDFGNGGARVYNNQDTEAILSSAGRPINLTVVEAKSENTTQAAVRAFEYLDTMYGNRL